MKCRIFWGCVAEAKDQFNEWAKGKSLTRDVIIHTQVTERIVNCEETSPNLLIIVFHPEGQQWESAKPIQPILIETIESPRMEREVIAQ